MYNWAYPVAWIITVFLWVHKNEVSAPVWFFLSKLDYSQFIMKKKWKKKDFDLIDRNWSIYAYWLSLLVLFFLLTLLNCFVECFYLVCSKIVAACQKCVTPFPRWRSVGVAKPWPTFHVGTVCDSQIMTGAKRRSVTCIIIYGFWAAVVELRQFARVIGRVFQWKQERLWIILISIFTS